MDPRQGLSWLLVGMVAVVTAGAAAIGVEQAPTAAPLTDAVNNTLQASSYNEVAKETTPQGSETAYLSYQAPDRLGGFVQSGSRRTYIVFIGNYEYQSVTVAAGASTKHLVFYRQAIAGGSAADPAHTYLKLASEGTNHHQSGNTTKMSISEAGQTVDLAFTISGQYVAQFVGSGGGSSVSLVISQVGNGRPVALPAGAKVVNIPNG
jgi:hypothetical protein